jgi:hypothetical protein
MIERPGSADPWLTVKGVPGSAWRLSDIFLLAAYIVSIVLVYLGLHGIYRPDHMDDPWFMSYAYNHVVNGIEHDIMYGTPEGQSRGVTLFFKSFSFLYGHVLNVLG